MNQEDNLSFLCCRIKTLRLKAQTDSWGENKPGRGLRGSDPFQVCRRERASRPACFSGALATRFRDGETRSQLGPLRLMEDELARI